MSIRYNLKFNLNKSNNILLLDGKYIVYRSQFSRSTSRLSYQGNKTGIYFHFFNTIRSLITKFKPSNLIIMWDGVGSIRKKEYTGYKNRNNMKYMKQEQIDSLKEVAEEYPNIVAICDTLGFAAYVLDGYEADDLIHLFVKQYKNIKIHIGACNLHLCS